MIKISVVCPIYNSANYIEETLKGIINQTLFPYEVIISDDGSDDNTLELVEKFIQRNSKKFKWHVLKNTHKGPGAARNYGIIKASGNWIAFLDSDDIWTKDKIEKVTKAITEHQNKNFFCNDELFIKKNGKVKLLSYGKRFKSSFSLQTQLYWANMFSTSAVTCQRDLLVNHGYFNENLMSAQDYELWIRLSPFIRPQFINEVLGKYIEREGNISSNNLKLQFKNEIIIALMYRKCVSNLVVFFRLVRIVLSYANKFVKYKIGL